MTKKTFFFLSLLFDYCLPRCHVELAFPMLPPFNSIGCNVYVVLYGYMIACFFGFEFCGPSTNIHINISYQPSTLDLLFEHHN